jgi:quercetin dioxygenase-like cupin family protein
MTGTPPRQTTAGQIPPDDPARRLAAASPDRHESLEHVGVVGDTYTILLSGRDTAGRYTLIDMHVPPGGGPPRHRHDFEEMFSILDGEIELTFRGETSTARTGDTVNIPASAPHVFRNASDRPARLLCLCAPAGQEDFFREIGVPLAHRTQAPPPLDADAQAGSWPKPWLSRRSTEPSCCSDPAKPNTVTTGHGHSIPGAQPLTEADSTPGFPLHQWGGTLSPHRSCAAGFSSSRIQEHGARPLLPFGGEHPPSSARALLGALRSRQRRRACSSLASI